MKKTEPKLRQSMGLERITITLSNRRPVSIISGDWPVVACAKMTVVDGKVKREFQLFARMNPDGRAIIYGNSSAGRGGKYLSTPHTLDKVAYQIGTVGRDLDVTTELIEKCIASLPAEVIDSGPTVTPTGRRPIRGYDDETCDEDDD